MKRIKGCFYVDVVTAYSLRLMTITNIILGRTKTVLLVSALKVAFYQSLVKPNRFALDKTELFCY